MGASLCESAQPTGKGDQDSPFIPTPNSRHTLQAFGCAFKLVSWHPALQCLVITPMVIVVCWVVGMLLRLIPGVKRVL